MKDWILCFAYVGFHLNSMSFQRSKTLRRLGVTLIPLVLQSGFVSFLPAQSSGSGSAAATYQLQSQLVLLDVVVTDESGNVVTNLGRDDFTVYENGVVQTIRNFDPPAREQAKLHSLPVTAPKDRNGHDNWGDAPLAILVIDALNTPFEEAAYVRNQVDRFLKAQPALLNEPTIALWLNDSGFHPVVPGFTRNRDALLTAIDEHKASLPDKLIRGAAVEQLSVSLSALQQMALFSRGNKGSKQIIWIGRSFPGVDGKLLNDAGRRAMDEAVSSTIDLLMASRASVYVIDPMGAQTQQMGYFSNIPDPGAITPFSPNDPFADSFSFKSFVEETGGRYFYAYNDLNNEIASSIEHGTNFYSISYAPAQPIQDNMYRKIDIRLTNPRLRVQTREGYYPVAAGENPMNPRTLRFDLREALATGMVYTGVGLRLAGCGLDQDHTVATCDLRVDNNTISFEGSEPHAAIIAAIAALDQHSVLLTNRVFRLGIRIPPDTMDQADLGSTRIQVHLAIPATAKFVRIAVRDASGRIGTVELNSAAISSLVAHPSLRSAPARVGQTQSD